jgi:hypothetical protein
VVVTSHDSWQAGGGKGFDARVLFSKPSKFRHRSWGSSLDGEFAAFGLAETYVGNAGLFLVVEATLLAKSRNQNQDLKSCALGNERKFIAKRDRRFYRGKFGPNWASPTRANSLFTACHSAWARAKGQNRLFLNGEARPRFEFGWQTIRAAIVTGSYLTLAARRRK